MSTLTGYKFWGKNLFYYSLFITFLYIICFLKIYNEFKNPHYDWDLDTEIYFGQNLLRGDLVWTKEFHDKLPLVQYFFIIPGALKSITSWRVISVLFIALTILIMYVKVPRLIGTLQIPKQHVQILTLFSGGIYLWICTSLPGGITHINAFAASSALITTVLALSIVANIHSKFVRFNLLLFSSLFFSFSVSFRPYYIYPLMLTFLIIYFLSIKPSHRIRDLVQNITKLYIIAIPLFTFLVINFLPYIVFRKINELIEGIRFIIDLPNPNNSLAGFQQSLFSNTLYMFLFGISYTLIIVLITQFIFSDSKSLLVNVIVPIQFFSLLIGILLEHWWSHYLNLFSWYFSFSIVFGVYVIFISNDKFKYFIKFNNSIIPKSLLIIFTLVFIILNEEALKIRNYDNQINNEVYMTMVIENFFKDLNELPHNYLAPYNMHSHYYFNVTRQGFPQAAHSIHIGEGKWSKTAKTSYFQSPKSAKKYCKKIRNSSIEFVFVSSESPIDNCMFDSNQGYFSLETLYDLRGYEIHVWRRT
jgi:hypothetical protein